MSSIAFNADLLDDLARRKVVLFVGAGASKAAKPRNGGVFKDWAEFLTDASANVGDEKKRKQIVSRIKNKDYLVASELLKDYLGEQWTRVLSAEFQRAADTPRLHKALISLDQRVIVTTNFDKLIEYAWADCRPNRYPNVISTVDHKVFRLFRNDDPYVIKLHGTIDAPDAIVFDKTSYQREAFANQFYRDLIGTLLLTHTFVFIGFSMDDPAISSVIESHAYRFFDSRPHYIFSAGSSDPAVDELSKTLRKLFVMRYSPKNGHIALVEAIEDLVNAVNERRRLIAIPRVELKV
jgi:hypothetical protein